VCFDIDLPALCGAFDSAGGEGLLALHRVPDGSRYGSVVLDGDRIVSFAEKKEAASPALINGGVAVVNAAITDRVRALPCSMETEIFPAVAAERRLAGRECAGYFIDMGLSETFEQARRNLIGLTQSAAAR